MQNSSEDPRQGLHKPNSRVTRMGLQLETKVWDEEHKVEAGRVTQPTEQRNKVLKPRSSRAHKAAAHRKVSSKSENQNADEEVAKLSKGSTWL